MSKKQKAIKAVTVIHRRKLTDKEFEALESQENDAQLRLEGFRRDFHFSSSIECEEQEGKQESKNAYISVIEKDLTDEEQFDLAEIKNIHEAFIDFALSIKDDSDSKEEEDEYSNEKEFTKQLRDKVKELRDVIKEDTLILIINRDGIGRISPELFKKMLIAYENIC